jgi:hypothetical protein
MTSREILDLLALLALVTVGSWAAMRFGWWGFGGQMLIGLVLLLDLFDVAPWRRHKMRGHE